MRVYRWQQTVTYAVRMNDVGEVDEETGQSMTADETFESALEYQESAMPIEYYPEDFVTIEEGPVEFLGMEVTLPKESPPCP